MIQKLIVMLVSVVRGRIQEQIQNFGHLVREIACEVFLNSIKSKRSPKIMKLVEMSSYHMWRL